jgi:hypothetical protein
MPNHYVGDLFSTIGISGRASRPETGSSHLCLLKNLSSRRAVPANLPAIRFFRSGWVHAVAICTVDLRLRNRTSRFRFPILELTIRMFYSR